MANDWLAERRTAVAADRILDAAEELFTRHDPSSVGMNEIAKAAGCSRATLYRYFDNHPFRDPEPGFLARVFAEEESAECHFGVPIVDGDQAAVYWTAQTRLVDGGTEDPAGVSLLRFNDAGLVIEHRDFWNAG